MLDKGQKALYYINNLKSYWKGVMYLRRDELKGIIVSRGKTQKDVADYLEMSEKTFNTKLKNGIFGSDDIDKMIDFLNI